MKECDIGLSDLMKKEALTFLVGAGCSVDSPSRQPAGRAMMDAMIQFACDEEEIERIIKLDELRFEALVEILRDNIDEDLKIIEYYAQSDKPNLQHFFLAHMINQGNFVMTTNFDFLIELSLLQMGVPREEIKVIITKKNFEKYHTPNDLFKNGIKTVYKIHGSTKNIIKNKDTKDTLVATIQAFGSNKEGMNVFQVEPFKRALFQNVSKHRSIIVMGYSGSDDFDVVPTLKVLENLKNVIWLNYIKEDGGKERIFEIMDTSIYPKEKLSKIDQILTDIKRMNNAEHVYRVDVNTSRMVEDFLEELPTLSDDIFDLNPLKWLEENLETPDKLMKTYIDLKIYIDFDQYDNAMRIVEKLLDLSLLSKDLKYQSLALNNMGMIFYRQGDFKSALKKYEESFEIDEKIGDISGIATRYNNVGRIYEEQGEFEKSLEYYRKSFNIADQNDFNDKKATYLNNMGSVFHDLGNYTEALKKYETSKQIYEDLGDLNGKSTVLNNLGSLYHDQGLFQKALEQYEEALLIDEQLANLSGKMTVLNNIGLL